MVVGNYFKRVIDDEKVVSQENIYGNLEVDMET